MKIGVPGALFMILEWGAFPTLNLISGYIPDQNYLAAQVVLENVCSVCIFLSYGLSQAATTLVGNAIGSDKTAHAKRTAKIVMTISVTFNLIMATLVLVLRK